jgi:biotin carboxyl carrier protein
LPEYNIVIENRPYQVELAKKEGKGQFEARVNDKPLELELEESEIGAHSPLTLRVAGKIYSVELDRIDRHAPFTLKINDALFQVQFKEPVKRRAALMSAAPVVARAEKHRGTAVPEGSIVAPMAGKIVSVRVKKGDAVKAGDVVCTLEAMKMENEITAAKAGTVQEVNVAEGTAVNEGGILITIK